MSQAVNPLAMNLSGYGPLEGRCLPCSGLSGRVVAISPRSCVDHRICSQLKTGSIKCTLRTASFVCNGSSGGHRRNPDFPRQNRQSFSRNRNRQNEERDSFENVDESSLLTSKNGPLLSLPNSSKFQATAAPGPKEKEILELFRKVQAQLRERAAIKDVKKVEASQGKAKENETVDSLLKLLRKHSIEQGKKKSSSINSGDLATDQHEQNASYNDSKTSFLNSNSNNKGRDDVPEAIASSSIRPPSKFQRKSPIPHVKFQPIYSSEGSVNSALHLNSSDERKQQSDSVMIPDAVQLPESELEEEEVKPEIESELVASFPDGDVLNVLSEESSSDNDEDEENEQQIEVDLSSMKLPELRALAKSRGVKGFSKMKKSELVELLSG